MARDDEGEDAGFERRVEPLTPQRTGRLVEFVRDAHASSRPKAPARREMTFDDMEKATMPLTVTITGTRSIDHRPLDDYSALFEEYLAPFASDGVRFYLGGARGIDSLALLWLARETGVTLSVAVPATLAEQPADARHAIANVRENGRLDELVELHGETRTPGYHARNRWMVDRSEFVIGFPHTQHPAGGTEYTLGYAAMNDKPQLVVPV